MEKHGYKLFIEQKYLHQVQRRASALREFKLVSIHYKNNELVFKLRSGTPPYKKIWTQRVVIQDLNALKVARLKFNDLAKFIQEANLKVSCDCEAFLYWGGAYWSYRKGFGLIKELRRPRVRQPLYQRYFCKHIYAVMRAYPWWSRILAKKYKQHVAETQEVNMKGTPSDDDLLNEILFQ